MTLCVKYLPNQCRHKGSRQLYRQDAGTCPELHPRTTRALFRSAASMSCLYKAGTAPASWEGGPKHTPANILCVWSLGRGVSVVGTEHHLNLFMKHAFTVQWRWPAAVAPRSYSQESGSNALVGRLCRARRAVLGFELVLPGIMRPLSYPPTLRVVLWHTRMCVQWCHWWLIYILNELSIFHIILFESMML